MKRYFVCLTLVILSPSLLKSQTKVSENIVVVTMDGLRWQEIFGGADSLLTFDTTASYNFGYVRERFWAESAEQRRKKLMPFFWSELSTKGVLLGNRKHGNLVNNANPYWFSYPGYNEIFTGFPDPAVNSNDKILNKNENVFEFLAKHPKFKGKVAVFGSWDVYSYIFNEKRSGLFVNDGLRDLTGNLTEREKFLNQQQYEMPDLFHGPHERLDVATFNLAMEYMKVHKPKLMYFGLGDTDEFAHGGVYDYYLDAVSKSDEWIKKIWRYIQSDPFYANKTTMIITTDHGRGSAAGGNWKHHGAKIEGASEMWIAAIGPSVKASGESKSKAQVYQGQIASTIAKMLGYDFKPAHKVLEPLILE